MGGFTKANSADDAAGLSTQEASALAQLVDKPPVWQ
jgi:hypothetical protein